MRLTPDLVLHAEQGLNCLGDRELVLRNMSIPVIENLAVARNSFDIMDLSANMISILGDGFPPFPRLQSLYLGSNRITKILPGFVDSLPNLQILILTSNRIKTLDDLNISALSRLTDLEVLSIRDNPVADVSDIRQTLIDNISSLKVLNFTKVTFAERQASNKRLQLRNVSRGTKRKLCQANGKHQKKSRGASTEDVKTFVVGGLGDQKREGPSNRKQVRKLTALTNEQSLAVKKLIENASSIEEVTRVQEALRNGTIIDILKKVDVKTPSCGDLAAIQPS